uniref:Protein wntless n=1 Tax=Megaselia scalaris TaxID=36166 RepID=T1GYF3_MEGSC
MPLPREGRVLDFSRWQQNLIGVLQVDVAFDKSVREAVKEDIILDIRLAYRNKNDPETKWTLYAHSLEKRSLDCQLYNIQDEAVFNCEMMPLFELGALHHDFYLLNIRLPMDTDMQMNTKIGHLHDLNLTVIFQNGGFTMFLTLEFEMPYMLLLSDIRQGVFYAILLSFWLIFAGEHMLIQDSGEKSTLKTYWKHLSAVVIGCFSLLIFDLCERGVQLRNPFSSIWTSRIGTHFALAFIILGGLSAGIYFLFLCAMIWKVFGNISMKRTSFSAMSQARRLHYEGIIYRFKFLMLATLSCAAVTIAAFILGQVSEGQYKWDEHLHVEVASAFLTGIYGMWNIYIAALLILYAPSHKQWPVEHSASNENIISEEIEFSNLPSDNNPSEISSLTSFSRKTAFD